MPVGFYYNIAPPMPPVNTYGLDNNCYFVTTAALLGTTVNHLVQATETMQQITGSHEDIKKLFSRKGVDDGAGWVFVYRGGGRVKVRLPRSRPTVVVVFSRSLTDQARALKV